MREVVAVYAAGLLQGLALVTFPAASAVLTSPTGYALSTAAYGAMFAPQTIMAVLAALLADRLGARWGQKRVLLVGLAANLASMALLVGSRFAMGAHAVAFALLLGATAFMGIGFGLTVPAINRFAAALFPRRVDVAVLALNALLGLGTALAPVLIALFVGLGAWWGLPLAVGVLLLALLGWSLLLPFAAAGAGPEARTATSRLYWLFGAFALCYGVVETLNGNWAILYMKGTLRAGASLAALTLTLFWAAATAGRLLFAAVERWLPARRTFALLPWVIALAFVATALVPASKPELGTAAFGLAGLGCSALLPLVISLGRGAASAGDLVACYQLGYGIAAFGVGPLHDRAGLSLRVVIGGGAMIALALAALSIAIGRSTSNQKGPRREAIPNRIVSPRATTTHAT